MTDLWLVTSSLGKLQVHNVIGTKVKRWMSGFCRGVKSWNLKEQLKVQEEKFKLCPKPLSQSGSFWPPQQNFAWIRCSHPRSVHWTGWSGRSGPQPGLSCTLPLDFVWSGPWLQAPCKNKGLGWHSCWSRPCPMPVGTRSSPPRSYCPPSSPARGSGTAPSTGRRQWPVKPIYVKGEIFPPDACVWCRLQPRYSKWGWLWKAGWSHKGSGSCRASAWRDSPPHLTLSH